MDLNTVLEEGLNSGFEGLDVLLDTELERGVLPASTQSGNQIELANNNILPTFEELEFQHLAPVIEPISAGYPMSSADTQSDNPIELANNNMVHYGETFYTPFQGMEYQQLAPVTGTL